MQMGRREFFKTSAALAAGMTLGAAPEPVEVRNGMPYRVLGRTGEKVSLLCVGGAHIGQPNVSDEDAIRIIRTAIDEGVNFLDNAWAYNGGRSEELMGKALKDGYRDKVLLMTKHKGRERAVAQQQLEDSLRRLDVDVIDLWQFHEVIEPDFPERIYNNGALDFAIEQREKGKIRYIGFTGHHYPGYLLEMITRGFEWDTVQMPLNVLDYHFRSFGHDVLPKAIEHNIGVIGMKSLGGSPGAIPKTGAATVEECLRFTMSLPVSTVCSGMDSIDVLRQNLSTAKSYTPPSQDELAALLERTKGPAATGEHEVYKTKWHAPKT